MQSQVTLDRALIQRIVPQEKAGGIHLPEEIQKKKANTFKVIKVGPGRMTDAGEVIPPLVKVGDTILIDNPGIEVEIDGEKYNVIRPESVLVIL